MIVARRTRIDSWLRRRVICSSLWPSSSFGRVERPDRPHRPRAEHVAPIACKPRSHGPRHAADELPSRSTTGA
jgi:hypothetical protein